MIINQLMALWLPGVLTLKVYEMIDGEEKSLQKMIIKYLKAILIINLLVYLILVYVIRKSDFIFTNEFTVKYMIMAIVISIIYPIIEKVIKTNIDIGVKVEHKNEKEN